MSAIDKKPKSNKTENNNGPGNTGLEKSRTHIIAEIIGYVPNCVEIKKIVGKSAGNISVMSFESGEGLVENVCPFDSFAQVIEGRAEIVIDNASHVLEPGHGIIIPAHSPNHIKPGGRCKIMLTVIKGGDK
jgi:quercetin dioxygenase-like cupin family protein